MRWSEVENKQVNVNINRTIVRAVFILDESGSMGRRQMEVINGFNDSICDMESDPNPVALL